MQLPALPFSFSRNARSVVPHFPQPKLQLLPEWPVHKLVRVLLRSANASMTNFMTTFMKWMGKSCVVVDNRNGWVLPKQRQRHNTALTLPTVVLTATCSHVWSLVLIRYHNKSRSNCFCFRLFRSSTSPCNTPKIRSRLLAYFASQLQSTASCASTMHGADCGTFLYLPHG